MPASFAPPLMRPFWWGLMACACLLAGCDYLSQLRKSGNADEAVAVPVARVHDKFLYQSDLTGLVPPRTLAKDSAALVQRYVDSWIRKQLLMHEAAERINMDEAEINRRMEDYRYDLIVYAYEKQFLEENLDTAITEAQIKQYYDEHQGNFELRQNIVQACYVKVSNQAQRLGLLRQWMQAGRPQMEQIREYAYGFASNYHLQDTLWVDFDDLVLGTPFSEELENKKVATLKNSRFLETSDSAFHYMLRVIDYKLSSEISPLEFVREQIRDILINKRRVELRRDHERDILNRAEKNEDYEIFE
jgi:hypothetical protein